MAPRNADRGQADYFYPSVCITITAMPLGTQSSGFTPQNLIRGLRQASGFQHTWCKNGIGPADEHLKHQTLFLLHQNLPYFIIMLYFKAPDMLFLICTRFYCALYFIVPSTSCMAIKYGILKLRRHCPLHPVGQVLTSPLCLNPLQS